MNDNEPRQEDPDARRDRLARKREAEELARARREDRTLNSLTGVTRPPVEDDDE